MDIPLLDCNGRRCLRETRWLGRGWKQKCTGPSFTHKAKYWLQSVQFVRKQRKVGRYKKQASYWNLRLVQPSFPLTMFYSLILNILLISSDLLQEVTSSKGEFSPFYPYFRFLRLIFNNNARYVSCSCFPFPQESKFDRNKFTYEDC